MQLIVQGHQVEITAPLRDYAEKKIGKLSHFYDNIQKVEIILDARHNKDSKRTQVAEVSMWVSGKRVLRATAGAGDMYSAIDMVFDKLAEQVKKHKDKRFHESRRRAEKLKESFHNLVPMLSVATDSNEPLIVRVQRSISKPMDLAEAKEELVKTDQEFLLFLDAKSDQYCVATKVGKKITVSTPKTKTVKKAVPEEMAKILKKSKNEFATFFNAATNELNVIYKRRSGNFGLVEPIL